MGTSLNGALLAAAAAIACASAGCAAGNDPPVCVTGAKKPCTCASGGYGSQECVASGGKWGPCSCASIDGGGTCVGVSCSGHGSCLGGTCVCDTGYSGESCSLCAAGYAGYPDCKPSSDPCAGVSCSGHGTCSAGTCTCNAGYAGASCDQCASGFSGYPNCQTSPDPCAGVTCSGHGTCSNGSCTCNAGYTGASCDQCASGYGLYPQCTKCTCTKGQLKCDGDKAINQCTNGCTWSSSSCAAVCLGAGYVSKSTGCANDWSASADRCWCPTSTSADVMLWTFRDTCNDNTIPTVGFYDSAGWIQVGPTYYLPTYNVDHQASIQCTTGHTICWGAWQGTKYWGCGQGCSAYCADCCWTCGQQLSIGGIGLGC